MNSPHLFVDILLPLHIPNYYTYKVPSEFQELIRIGQSVLVEFGKNRLYSGLVRSLHSNRPSSFQAKEILSILDPHPYVHERNFLFWEWMARYYLCYTGDVMVAALPASFRLKSESYIHIHPDFDGDVTNLTKVESDIILSLLEKESVRVQDMVEIVGIQKILPIIKALDERKIICIQEEVERSYQPSVEKYLRLHSQYQTGERISELLIELGKRKIATKQLSALLLFFKEKNEEGILKKKLSDLGVSNSTISTLVNRDVFEVFTKEVCRWSAFEKIAEVDSICLSELQACSYSSIVLALQSKEVCLLHGITSSGKTELYIKLIQDTISEGRQVLFLLPEIALTIQIINRLRRYFGNIVGVYHSKFNKQERADIWRRTMDPTNGFRILLGARSSVFLPFYDLGLVIVDEEHDVSYKQMDPSPRYNARDAAVYLAKLYGAKTVLGSATPSIESYHHAIQGKYGFVEMKERFGGVLLPEIVVSDMKEATVKKEIRSHFSLYMLEQMQIALQERNQIILFQNRRGFSIRLECETCHWIPQCKFCDVSLTYHKSIHQLKCHYCGYIEELPNSCPSCSSTFVKMKGFGTEKLEEELSIFFPEASIARMDLDTTRKKNSYEKIISDFEEGRIDILVGTQMLSKGLNFDRVALVGIMSADNMISFPDFRSYERSFQQMVQVSGRAGRRQKRGKVVIQTYNPYHQVIRDVIAHDYVSMYNSQIQERSMFKYPPFYRLIKLSLKHRNEELLNKAAECFAKKLRKTFDERVLGPEYPLVAKVKDMYIKQLMIRIEKELSYSHVKIHIQQAIVDLYTEKSFSNVTIVPDVDPY